MKKFYDSPRLQVLGKVSDLTLSGGHPGRGPFGQGPPGLTGRGPSDNSGFFSWATDYSG